MNVINLEDRNFKAYFRFIPGTKGLFVEIKNFLIRSKILHLKFSEPNYY